MMTAKELYERLLQRLGYGFSDDAALRKFFENGLPDNYRIYGYFHWLILDHGIARCRKTPRCAGCPFEECKERKSSAKP